MTYTLGSLREDFLKQLKKELEWSGELKEASKELKLLPRSYLLMEE